MIVVTQVIIFILYFGTMCYELDYILPLSSTPPLLPLPLFQEVELQEACYYGLVGQVHHLLTTGVNVNMTTLVSACPTCAGFSVLYEHYTVYSCTNISLIPVLQCTTKIPLSFGE